MQSELTMCFQTVRRVDCQHGMYIKRMLTRPHILKTEELVAAISSQGSRICKQLLQRCRLRSVRVLLRRCRAIAASLTLPSKQLALTHMMPTDPSLRRASIPSAFQRRRILSSQPLVLCPRSLRGPGLRAREIRSRSCPPLLTSLACMRYNC